MCLLFVRVFGKLLNDEYLSLCYARAILTLCFFTVTIISTVSGEVIHFGSNMEYVPDEVLQRDYISDEDLLKVVEDIEQQQSGGGAGGSGEESSQGFFKF